MVVTARTERFRAGVLMTWFLGALVVPGRNIRGVVACANPLLINVYFSDWPAWQDSGMYFAFSVELQINLKVSGFGW